MALKEMSCYSLSECLRVQMDGTKVCQDCDLYKTDRCGGMEILKTGKNKKGYNVSENGLNSGNENESSKKKKKKKR